MLKRRRSVNLNGYQAGLCGVRAPVANTVNFEFACNATATVHIRLVLNGVLGRYSGMCAFCQHADQFDFILRQCAEPDSQKMVGLVRTGVLYWSRRGSTGSRLRLLLAAIRPRASQSVC